MTVQHFLFEQPENVQYFVIGAAQAEGGSEMALKEIKRAFGDKYSDEEIYKLYCEALFVTARG